MNIVKVFIEKLNNNNIIIIIGLIPILFGFYVLIVFFCCIQIGSYNHVILAQLGDFFGGILNPVIAYIGLVAIIFTYNHNREILRQDFVSLQDTQKAHIEAIAQSTAISVFNTFEDEVQRVRSKSNNTAYDLKRDILQGINMPDNPLYKGYLTQMIMEWGAVARIFSLIIKITKPVFLDADIVAAAIAMMDKDERDYVMICLAKLSHDSLRYMVDNKDNPVSEEMNLALQKIANI